MKRKLNPQWFFISFRKITAKNVMHLLFPQRESKDHLQKKQVRIFVWDKTSANNKIDQATDVL